MIKLDSGNVLLKPSHRRQLMTWLRRAQKLGERIGQFLLNITFHRSGKCCEVSITCADRFGKMTCRAKRHDWKDAMRDLARRIEHWLHDQQLAHAH